MVMNNMNLADQMMYDLSIGLDDNLLITKEILNTLKYMLKMVLKGRNLNPRLIIVWSKSILPQQVRELIYYNLQLTYRQFGMPFTVDNLSFKEFNEVDPEFTTHLNDMIDKCRVNWYLLMDHEGIIYELTDNYEANFKRAMADVYYMTFNDEGFVATFLHNPFNLYQM